MQWYCEIINELGTCTTKEEFVQILDCLISDIRWDILVYVWIQKDNRIRGLRTELIVFDDIRELSEENKQIIRDLFDESIYDEL